MSPPSTQLFQTEALEATKAQWLGAILLIRPLIFTVLLQPALSIALALAALFVFGQYTKRALVMGQQAPGLRQLQVVDGPLRSWVADRSQTLGMFNG